VTLIYVKEGTEMKKLLMIVLFTSVIVGMALSALAVERRPPRPQPAGSCTGPVISSVEVQPNNLWAPAGKDVTIEVSGVVKAADNCEIKTVTLMMGSDRGNFVTNIEPDEEGNFSGTVTVALSKDGKLKEGTTYYGVVLARDSEGNTSHPETFDVTVLHDRGK